MALPWFKVDVDLSAHPKIALLEQALAVPDALGIVIRLFTWTAKYAPLGNFPAEQGAAMAVFVTRDASVTVSRVTDALALAGIIERPEGRIVVHDWVAIQGALVRIADQNRQRQRKHRAKKRNVKVTRDVTPMSRGKKRREENRRDQVQEHAQSDAPHPSAPTATAFQLFVVKHWPDVKEPADREAEWQAACPGVDLLAEGKKALSWENETARHRKTDHGKFLGNWFRRAQDNGSRAGLQTFDQRRRQERAEVFGSLLRGDDNGVDARGAQPDRIGAGDHNGVGGRDVQQGDGALLPARTRTIPG